MTLEQLNTALYEKVYAEQQGFISSLKTMTPENIIQYAYELVIREDILLSLEENDLMQVCEVQKSTGISVMLTEVIRLFLFGW